MLQYMLMCKSLTYAQRASRALEHSGITATITKAPKSVSGSGCNYCVKVSQRHLVNAVKTLKAAEIGPSKVLLMTENGDLSEVFL